MEYDYYDDIEETEEEVIVLGTSLNEENRLNKFMSIIKKWFLKLKKIISILKE